MFSRSSTPPTGPRGSSPARRGLGRGGIQKRRAGHQKVDKDGDLVMDQEAVGRGVGRSEDGRSSKGRGVGRGGQGSSSSSRGHLFAQQSQQAIIRGLESHQANVLESRISQGAFPGDGRASRKDGQRDSQASLISLRVRGLRESKAASNPGGGLGDLLSFLERKATGLDVEHHKPVRIKKSHVEGDSVIITASPGDLATILKLNNFKFAGSTLIIESHQLSTPGPSRRDEDHMSHEAQETQDRIKVILSTRYDMNLKLLNLSRLGQDQGLLQMGMFDAENRISKLFPVLMVVCDRLFTSSQAKRDAILSVTLADNDLDNISTVAALAQTFPDLQNLDLSQNRIADLRALEGWQWKFRSLQNLKLTGNPIENTSPGYTQEIVNWFPTLQILNDVQIRTAEEAAALSKTVNQSRKSDQVSPIPINGPDFRDVNQIGEGFLRQFFALYDKDRTTLANTFYDSHSTHSLSINIYAPRAEDQTSSHPFPSTAFKNSRNLVKLLSLPGQISKMFRGVEAIKSLWADLPRTQHPDLSAHTAKYIVDCHPLPGLLDPSGQISRGVDGLVLMVHGEYEEVDTSKPQNIMRSFSRTFVLGPGLPAGPIIRVISDILVLRAWSPLASASVELAAAAVTTVPGTESAQEDVLAQLIFQTRMTPEYAKMCLAETGWDLEKAIAAFEANKSKLPASAFMTP